MVAQGLRVERVQQDAPAPACTIGQPGASRGSPALTVRDLAFSYAGRGGPSTLHDITFTVERGETLAIMGPSGSGKTTLLKVLAGVRPAGGGQVDVCPGAPARKGRVGYIPQQLGLVRTRTALENVLMGSLARTGLLRSLLGVHAGEDVAAAEALLGRVGLLDKKHRRVAELSGGERQRVAIARTFLQRPDVLLADEFTSNLDVVKAGEVLDIVREFTARGMGTVLCFHNLELAREYADRILFIRDGRPVALHSARDVTHDLARRLLA